MSDSIVDLLVREMDSHLDQNGNTECDVEIYFYGESRVLAALQEVCRKRNLVGQITMRGVVFDIPPLRT